MKKHFVLLFVGIIAMFFVSTSAAVYTVKKGDCLCTIAKTVNCNIADLVVFNEIGSANSIIPEQKIFYLSSDDLSHAKSWCEKRIKELALAPQYYEDLMYFKYSVKDLSAHNIRYSNNTPNGMHAKVILVFAAAWEKYSNIK